MVSGIHLHAHDNALENPTYHEFYEELMHVYDTNVIWVNMIDFKFCSIDDYNMHNCSLNLQGSTTSVDGDLTNRAGHPNPAHESVRWDFK